MIIAIQKVKDEYFWQEMELLSLENPGNLIFLRLQSPHNRNALSRALVSELFSTFAQIREMEPSRARVLLIIGSQSSFCAGADLKERATMTAEEVPLFLADLKRLFLELEDLPLPTIAVLEGPAFGGGLELALCSDIRIAEESVVLGLTETKLGIIPGAGGTQRLPRLVGWGKAKEWIYSGKKLTAKEAYDGKLVEHIVTNGNGISFAEGLAQQIAESAPIAVRQAKLAIQGGWDLDRNQALDWEYQCYSKTLTTIDRREALEAFQQKRKPIFQGK